MAIEFARVIVIGRSNNRTIVKAAAYRSATKLFDVRNGRKADFRYLNKHIYASEILLPASADDRFYDRLLLWETVEDIEDRSNHRATAQLAKDNIIGLPNELDGEHHLAMARAFAQEQFVSKGLVVDLNINHKSKNNPYAHLLTTTRPLVGSEFGKKYRLVSGHHKSRKKFVDEIQLREHWKAFQEKYFKEHGFNFEIIKNDGVQKPYRHLGYAHILEEKGVHTYLGDINREIRKQRIADMEEAEKRKLKFSEFGYSGDLAEILADDAVMIAFTQSAIDTGNAENILRAIRTVATARDNASI